MSSDSQSLPEVSKRIRRAVLGVHPVPGRKTLVDDLIRWSGYGENAFRPGKPHQTAFEQGKQSVGIRLADLRKGRRCWTARSRRMQLYAQAAEGAPTTTQFLTDLQADCQFGKVVYRRCSRRNAYMQGRQALANFIHKIQTQDKGEK